MSREAALKHIEDFAQNFVCPDKPHDHDLADDITVLIKTFERPICIAWAITSLRTYFPTIKVLVCDDAKIPLFDDQYEPLPGVKWLRKPYTEKHTAGAGRNYLIRHVDTKYFFLTDDDTQFVLKTDIRAMWSFLEEHYYDIVGATETPWSYGAATFEIKDKKLVQNHYAHYGKITENTVKCDRVVNCFLALTKNVSPVQWEEAIGKNTHADFFYRAKLQGLKVAQMGGIHMTHRRNCEKCETVADWFKGIWCGHVSEAYRISMYGGGENLKAAKEEHFKLYKKYILDKNNIEGFVVNKSFIRRLKMFFLIGHPAFNFKKIFPWVR